MRIVLANGKGGVGKSTLALLLALAAREAGRPAKVTDMDPQQTLLLTLKALDFDVMGGGGAIEIVDTPPALSSRNFEKGVIDGDIVIVPSGPSPADALSTAATVATLKRLGVDGKSRLLFNRVKPHTRLAASVGDLSGRIGLESLSAHLSDRQCYQHVFLSGWGALTGVAREEVFKLSLEVFTNK